MNSILQPESLHTATQQRTRIQNQAFQAAINGEPLANCLNILARMVKLELGNRVRTAFYLAYPDGKRLHAIEGSGDMAPSYTVPLNGFPVGDDSFCSGYAIATGRPVHTRDVCQNPLWQPYLHMATAHGFRATSSYPILTRQGKAIGSLALYFPDVHEATAQEGAVANAITQAAAIILSQDTQTLEHTRAEEALRQSQEKYRTLFETIDEGYAFCKLVRDQTGRATDYRILESNPAFEQQIGALGTDFLGRTAHEVFPDHDGWWIDTYARVVDTNQAVHTEHPLDNTGRWYAISAYPRGGDHFAVIFDDITERKRHERQQAFLLRFSDNLRIQADADALANRALQLLAEQLQLDRCFIAVYRLAEDRVEITHQVGNDGVPPMPHSIRSSDFPDAFQIGFEGTLVIDDVATMGGLTERERQTMGTLGFSALVSATLRQGEHQPRWVLVAGSARPRSWRPEEIKLIEEVTERTWAAVERARAQQALRESEQQFRLLADTLPQAIWMTDQEGNVEFLNKWWSDYSGIPFEPTTAWQVANDSLHPEDGPLLVVAFRQAMQQEKGFAFEQRNRSASGEYRWFLNMGEPYRDPKTGQITKWVGMSIDIDDRKRTQQALQDSEARLRELSTQLEQQVDQRTQELASANDQLRAANEELTEANALLYRSNENLQRFAYVASHDLQEPLRKIQQFGDLLTSRFAGTGGEEVRYVERMQSAASRMSRLIRDLLNFSRISTQREERDQVSLMQVVQDALVDLDLLIDETRAQVIIHPLPTVAGNILQLGQVFGNLISNALKFRRRGVPPVIELRAGLVEANDLPTGVKPNRKAATYHLIEVIDNGIGFDEKYLDRMFEVFQRLHDRSAYEGTGIGLAIVHKVILNHGGAITAHSEPGQGATFALYLPA